MCIVDVGCEPAAIGNAVGGDGNITAPSMLDLDVVELWENREHARAHVFAEIERLERRVAGTSAKEKARVLGQAEVIDDEIRVRDGIIVTDKRLRPVLAQGFGRDDIARDWH